MLTPLLRISDLSVRYHYQGRHITALDKVSLDVAPGSITAVVGASGSGKSTLARTVLGMLPDSARITHGAIEFAGNRISPMNDRLRRAYLGNRIGYVPQDPYSALDPVLRVGDQIAEVFRRGSRLSRREIAPLVVDLLERVGVPAASDRARQYPHELSGGLRQRVVIGMALALRPQLVIADEPTSALDVSVQKRVLDLLVELSADYGAATLLITHDLAVATDRASDVLVMKAGAVVERGVAADLLVEPRHDYTRELVRSAPALLAPARTGQGTTGIAREVPVREEDVPAETVGSPILLATGLRKTFSLGSGRGASSMRALDDVSLTLREGGSLGIVGESGSGKSTLARVVSQLTEPDSGEVRIIGEATTGWQRKDRRTLRTTLQYVYQDPFVSLDPRWRLGQIVAEPLRAFGRGNARERAEAARRLLLLVGLPEEFESRRPGEISGGQRQRVAIARALALEPRILVLDEPVSALDVLAQAHMLELFAQLKIRLDLSYLFISHDLSVVRLVCEDVVVMRAGKIIESGPVEEVFGNPRHPYTRQLVDAVPGHRGVIGARG